MAEVQTFFLFCPSCGKRFHIKLVGKKLVDSKRETYEQKQFVMGGNSNPMTYGYRGDMGRLMLEENIPVTVGIEDFQYSYKCKHCGHEWTENRAERRKVGGMDPMKGHGEKSEANPDVAPWSQKPRSL
jgi:hypothetical protein